MSEQMSESEWLAYNDEPAHLDDQLAYFHRDRQSRRKCRLLACAFCEQVAVHFRDAEVVTSALQVAERHAEGLASDAELRAAHASVCEYIDSFPRPWNHSDLHRMACQAVMRACWTDPAGQHGLSEGLGYVMIDVPIIFRYVADALQLSEEERDERHVVELRMLCDLVREVFGNPFRPITFNLAWRTTDVMLLAQGIYEARAFDRMPILADALQDAGCDNADILGHCRDTNATHVRGCWVVDLVLGKE